MILIKFFSWIRRSENKYFYVPQLTKNIVKNCISGFGPYLERHSLAT